jgi:hypothetical protein
MPSGYNILFVLVDQEHFFPTAVPGAGARGHQEEGHHLLEPSGGFLRVLPGPVRDLHRPAHRHLYRFSRYFSPLRFNTPDSLEELLAMNDVEVYGLHGRFLPIRDGKWHFPLQAADRRRSVSTWV